MIFDQSNDITYSVDHLFINILYIDLTRLKLNIIA